jgi:hypothetical protein
VLAVGQTKAALERRLLLSHSNILRALFFGLGRCGSQLRCISDALPAAATAVSVASLPHPENTDT